MALAHNGCPAESAVESRMLESPAPNWGFRGMTGDEIKLRYLVNV